MKQITQILLSLTLALFVISCGGDTTPETSEGATTTTEATESAYTSLEEITENHEAYEEEGKIVTVQVYSQGLMKVNGVEQMQLTAKAESELGGDFIVLVFDDEADPLRDIEKGTQVTLKGKLGSDSYGAPKLINAEKL